MREKKILIIGNGERPSSRLVAKLDLRDNYIIAADGGLSNCNYLGLKPDIITGDLDSVDKHEAHNKNIDQYNVPDQNFTDLEKALDHASSLSPDSVVLIGFSGLRSDHFLNNIIILHNSPLSDKITFYDLYGKMIFLTAGNHRLTVKKDSTISFFALSPLQKLNWEGLQYPVNSEMVPVLYQSISNVTKEDTCVLSFEGGKLIVYEKIL